MKLTFLLILLAFFSLNCGSFSTRAQIRANYNGRVGTNNTNAQVTTKIPLKTDIKNFDFKNFTYPDLFDGKTDKSFALKNGQFRNEKATQRVYTLRKTYYFDITGDQQDEAITQIIAEGCGTNCDSHSLFYVHTIENNQPKLIWKIATGSEALGGLKAVTFKDKEIILETFGSCTIEGALIKAGFDKKNPTKILPENYTRFVFSMPAKDFSQTGKDLLPLIDKNIAGYRAQINFGEPD